MGRSNLEASMRIFLRLVDGLPEWEEEYKFHSKRKWRFDFAWPQQKVAIEVDGGLSYGQKGRGRNSHGGIVGATKDARKRNIAQIEGWIVLRVTATMLNDVSAINYVIDALNARGLDLAVPDQLK